MKKGWLIIGLHIVIVGLLAVGFYYFWNNECTVSDKQAGDGVWRKYFDQESGLSFWYSKGERNEGGKVISLKIVKLFK